MSDTRLDHRPSRAALTLLLAVALLLPSVAAHAWHDMELDERRADMFGWGAPDVRAELRQGSWTSNDEGGFVTDDLSEATIVVEVRNSYNTEAHSTVEAFDLTGLCESTSSQGMGPSDRVDHRVFCHGVDISYGELEVELDITNRASAHYVYSTTFDIQPPPPVEVDDLDVVLSDPALANHTGTFEVTFVNVESGAIGAMELDVDGVGSCTTTLDHPVEQGEPGHASCEMEVPQTYASGAQATVTLFEDFWGVEEAFEVETSGPSAVLDESLSVERNEWSAFRYTLDGEGTFLWVDVSNDGNVHYDLGGQVTVTAVASGETVCSQDFEQFPIGEQARVDCQIVADIDDADLLIEASMDAEAAAQVDGSATYAHTLPVFAFGADLSTSDGEVWHGTNSLSGSYELDSSLGDRNLAVRLSHAGGLGQGIDLTDCFDGSCEIDLRQDDLPEQLDVQLQIGSSWWSPWFTVPSGLGPMTFPDPDVEVEVTNARTQLDGSAELAWHIDVQADVELDMVASLGSEFSQVCDSHSIDETRDGTSGEAAVVCGIDDVRTLDELRFSSTAQVLWTSSADHSYSYEVAADVPPVPQDPTVGIETATPVVSNDVDTARFVVTIDDPDGAAQGHPASFEVVGPDGPVCSAPLDDVNGTHVCEAATDVSEIAENGPFDYTAELTVGSWTLASGDVATLHAITWELDDASGPDTAIDGSPAPFEFSYSSVSSADFVQTLTLDGLAPSNDDGRCDATTTIDAGPSGGTVNCSYDLPVDTPLDALEVTATLVDGDDDLGQATFDVATSLQVAYMELSLDAPALAEADRSPRIRLTANQVGGSRQIEHLAVTLDTCGPLTPVPTSSMQWSCWISHEDVPADLVARFSVTGADGITTEHEIEAHVARFEMDARLGARLAYRGKTTVPVVVTNRSSVPVEVDALLLDVGPAATLLNCDTTVPAGDEREVACAGDLPDGGLDGAEASLRITAAGETRHVAAGEVDQLSFVEDLQRRRSPEGVSWSCSPLVGGQEADCELTGFAPGERVHIVVRVNPTLFDSTLVADQEGTIRFGFDVPVEFSGQLATLTAVGEDATAAVSGYVDVVTLDERVSREDPAGDPNDGHPEARRSRTASGDEPPAGLEQGRLADTGLGLLPILFGAVLAMILGASLLRRRGGPSGIG